MIKIKYKSDGYYYEDEIPSCQYCKKTAEETLIFETWHNGILICDSSACALQYVTDEIKMCEFERIEVLVCDDCEQVIDQSIIDPIDGRELCVDCESEIVIDKIKKNGYI